MRHPDLARTGVCGDALNQPRAELLFLGTAFGTQVTRGLSDPRLGRLPTSRDVGHVDDTTLMKARLT